MSGTLVVISSPSGGGKNTVMRELIARIPNTARVVTTTTRAPREKELDGIDYYFLERSVFEEKLAQGEFVEYNEYAGNLYGLQKVHLDEALQQYRFVYCQADVHGKQSLDRLGIPHISIFLLPESLDVLEERVVQRGDVSDESLAARLEIAHDEIAVANTYELAIVNKNGALEEVVGEIVGFLGQASSISREADANS
jgi:guanylate kinase